MMWHYLFIFYFLSNSLFRKDVKSEAESCRVLDMFESCWNVKSCFLLMITNINKLWLLFMICIYSFYGLLHMSVLTLESKNKVITYGVPWWWRPLHCGLISVYTMEPLHLSSVTEKLLAWEMDGSSSATVLIPGNNNENCLDSVVSEDSTQGYTRHVHL